MPHPTQPSTYSLSVYERAGSPFWWALCYFTGGKGEKHRWSTGVRILPERRESRKLAESGARQEADRRAAEQAQTLEADSSAALEAVGKRMLRQKIADGRRTRAVKTLGWQLQKHVFPFFGKRRDIRTIRRADLESFKGKLRQDGLSGRSINNSLSAIRQVLKYASRVEELLESVPEVANVAVSNEPKGRALTPEQFTALIASLDPRAVEARHFLVFIGNTGLRKSEALSIRWGWIDWAERVIRVPAEHRKGGWEQTAPTPLNDVALAVLEERRGMARRREKRMRYEPDRRVFLQLKHDEARNSAAKKAKLGRVRTHDLRYTYGSLQHAAGTPLAEVRDLLGHRTMAMVNHYARTYSDRLREAAGRVQLGSVPSSVSTPGSPPREKCARTTRLATDGKSCKLW
jgi:integrase